jgi:hypothetical protein
MLCGGSVTDDFVFWEGCCTVPSHSSDRLHFLLLLLQGHSIGGAMAVLLMLMFCHRGVLQPEQISPVYTFGSPAVFCDGAVGGWGPCAQQQPGSEADSCTLVRTAAWAVVGGGSLGVKGL